MNTDVIYPIAQFAARSLDEKILRDSSSGGVFTELARVVFSRGGVVVAAGWNHETMTVEHRCVETEDGLSELRGSKYVTSDMAGVYRPMDRYLSEGRMVLFVGTPCQTSAIRRRYGASSNLLICAIACHSNVPADVWTLYCKELQNQVGSRIVDAHFRDKRKGWRQSTICIEFEDKEKNISESLYGNFYSKVFFSGWATKASCLNCGFRAGHSGADLLIGDFWGIEDVDQTLDDAKGVSVVMVYTQGGGDLLNTAKIAKATVSYSQAVRKNPYIDVSPPTDMVKRARFQKVYRKCKLRDAMRYAEFGPLPRELLIRVYRFARHFAGRLIGVFRE